MSDVTPPAGTLRPVGLLRAAWILFRKDLLIEWRTRARLNALVFFALATLLLFSFALGPDTSALRKAAGGYLWLAILFASTLALGESFRVENENAAMDGVRLAPADPRAIFLGKALGNTALLFLLGCLLLPFMIAVYDVHLVPPALERLDSDGLELWRQLAKFLGVMLLGCLAISAPGTIFSAIANNAKARDVLLPLLLFPLIIPALLSSVKATQLILQGDAMDELSSWLMLLGAFDVIYWGLCFALFPRVIED